MATGSAITWHSACVPAYPTATALGNEQYEGVGVMLNPFCGGVTGERFGYSVAVQAATPPQVDLADDTIHLVEMQADNASASHRVIAKGSGQSTGWKSYAQPAALPPLQRTGLLFAFLCHDDDGRCEAFDAAFRVGIFDIVARWR